MTLRIAIPIFPGFTATDAIGPYEVLSRIPGASVHFVATTPGPIATDTGFLRFVAEPFDVARTPDLVVMPGGPVRNLPLADEPMLDYLRGAHATSKWTTSVCTGSLVLGAAGLLRGRRATTHWTAFDALASHGADPVTARYVFDGKIATAAGVSAGFDLALALVAKLVGDDVAKAIQLWIEYDPQPPFDAGAPARAPQHVIDLVKARDLRPAVRA